MMQCEKDEQESMKRKGGGGGGVQHRDMRINLSFPFPVLADQFILETITSGLQLCAVLKNWITHIHLYITKDFSLWFTHRVMTSASWSYFFLLVLDFNIFIQY